jgi:hypothetical protein
VEHATGQLLHLRLFLEGIEVPVVSGNVTAQIGVPATAQVEIIPTDRALELLARTTVHMFYLDYEEARYDGIGVDLESGASPSGQTLSEGEIDKLRNKHYKLLFCGELFSIAYVKSGFGQRSVILQCLDFSNMWDTNYLYSLRYQNITPGDGQGSAIIGNQMNTLGTTTEALNDIVGFPETVVSSLASSRRVANNPALLESRDLVGSLFSILELLGGVQGKYFGVNSWATIQERRVRLMDQIGSDSGSAAVKLYEQAVFENWLTDKIGSAGAVVSFRDLINMINSYIYYDVAPNPVARYIKGEKGIPAWDEIDSFVKELGLQGLTLSEGGTEVTLDPFTGALIQKGQRRNLNPWFLERLTAVEADMTGAGWNGSSPDKPRPRESQLINKRSNLHHAYGHAADIVPDGIELVMGFDQGNLISGTYNTRADASLSWYGRMHYHFTRTASPEFQLLDPHDILQPSDRERFAIYIPFFKDLHRIARNNGLSLAGGEEVVTDDDGVKSTVQHLSGGIAQEFVWASQGMKWDPIHIQSPFAIELIREEWSRGVLTGVSPASKVFSKTGKGTTSSATPASATKAKGQPSPPRERLLTQIFRPDVWFVPPPVCNIIFPEEYVSFSYNRQMMREVTRLELTTFNAIYEDAIVNQYYFAPIFEGVESLSAGGIGSAAKAIIYPHEKFSGVIPKMERISEVSFYAKLTDAQGRAPLSKELPKEGFTGSREIGEDAQPIVNLIERFASQVAAYNFLTARYQSRSASLTGRFMPRVVCGWPALIVNRPEEGPIDPLHFLGMVSNVNHSLSSQGGGTTSISLSHVRSHRTGDRTDDLFSKSLFTKANILSIRRVGGTELKTKITVTQGMTVEEYGFADRAFTLLLEETMVRTEPNLPPEQVKKVLSGVLSLTDIPTDFLGPNKAKIKRIEIGTIDDTKGSAVDQFDETRIFSFRDFTIVEAVSGEVVPLEEAIRPPWFSDEYSNQNIGDQIYKKLFGCKSLVDAVGVKPAKGESIVSIERAADAVVKDYTTHTDKTNANAFIYGSTRREFATLPEVMNSFHAQAFGVDKTGLSGLDIAGITLRTQYAEFPEQELKSGASTKLDPRKERGERVNAYLDELLRSRGLRG